MIKSAESNDLWEYDVEPEPPVEMTCVEVADILSDFGREGWELVCVAGGKLIFKRLVASKSVRDWQRDIATAVFGGQCPP